MSKAMQIFNAAFNTSRQKRSAEYKDGALYILMLSTGEGNHCDCPHPLGTAQADAWFHGCSEGHELWRAAQFRASQAAHQSQHPRVTHGR